MKIWHGYGSEHSANLVIIGKFDSTLKAQEALELLEQIDSVANSDHDAGHLVAGGSHSSFTADMLEVLKANNVMSFDYSDPENFIYEHEFKQVASDVVITTDEINVMAFLKVLIDKGAKVEMFSAHNHSSPHGR